MRFTYLRFHGWRGFGPAEQGDLFSVSRRFGFVTVNFCRVCLIERLQQLKALTADAEQRRRDYDGQ
jgi:hypothetical protein